ncbi:hypothetical protein KS4_30420 [Poriferisphaera corsica]|uniref:Secreted protein n=1 Tax=Poriferisphaera corsica TaxID=2528020 RepID=A0A517YXL1_9BACT|nr:hypothetical protein [Poriferisphaera corsica]QDU34965.1 hypothetical protein KS4_30420 [Poriferisphaera corsica]
MLKSCLWVCICLMMIGIAGCTMPHGIAENDTQFTRPLLTKKSPISLANVTILHAGDPETNDIYGVHTSRQAKKLAAGGASNLVDMNDNRPTSGQAEAMGVLDDRMVMQMREELSTQLGPMVTYRQAIPTVHDENPQHVQQFIQRHRLAAAIDVKITMMFQALLGGEAKPAIRTEWRLIDPESEVRLAINTLTMLRVDEKVGDTRDESHHAAYLAAVSEATEDFAVYFYQAMTPPRVK